LDRFTAGAPFAAKAEPENVVGFKNALFTWSHSSTSDAARLFTLRIDGEVTFRTGVVNLITGTFPRIVYVRDAELCL
jgi:hypothetical protein